MERNKLISYSFYYRGHYDKITRAIENNEDIMIDRNINAITILDEIYPKSFLDLKSPPYVLYYKGNLDLLKDESGRLLDPIIFKRKDVSQANHLDLHFALCYNENTSIFRNYFMVSGKLDAGCFLTRNGRILIWQKLYHIVRIVHSICGQMLP